MLSVKEAQEKVLECKVELKNTRVAILECLNKVLAEDIVSNDFIPAFDNSAMDGFAVRSIDIIGADKNYPVKLRLLKEDIPAGRVPKLTIESGFAAQIMTGAPIPDGSDCVVIREDTLKEGRDVLVFKECLHGENIRYRGEDIKKGDIILKSGKKLYPGDIGIMASIGISEIFVYKPPVVGILSTGDELVEIGEGLLAGKVRNSNSYCLAAQIIETGAVYKMYGIVRDDKQLLKEKISEAIAGCDILLVSGGVSVGDYDYVKEILDGIGAEFVFWRVNQHPGKPLAFLTYKDKFIYGLPENPVSAMVCFEMYVRPLIKKIMGDPKLFKNKISAKALQEHVHKEGRADFIRVVLEKINKEFYFKPTGMQGSGILTSVAEADGLAVFTEDKGTVSKDDEIEVYLLRD